MECLARGSRLCPLEGGAGESRRTFVGVSPVSGTTKVYILSSNREMTLSQARFILETFGSDLEMQLDGGGSTQTRIAEPSNLCPCAGFPSYIGRDVPDVLAVYEAP